MAIKQTNTNGDQLHVLMFPFFAFGHVGPFAQLSNKLSSHGLRVSFLTIPGFVRRVEALFAPARSIQVFPIELPVELGLDPNLAGTADLAPAETWKLIAAMDLMRPRVEKLLSELRPDFVVFDFAQHWLPSMAAGLGVKAIMFSVFSAISNAYLIVPNRLAGVEGDIPTVEDIMKPPQGFPLLLRNDNNSEVSLLVKPFQARDFLFMYRSREGIPSNFDTLQEGISGCCAYAIKTCHEMEGPYLDFMKSQLKKPFILTGPLVPELPSPTAKLTGEFADWLAKFPEEAVVFCSFGSETFLTENQIRELALGLELSGQPFFLVLNFPKDVDTNAELARALPPGFSERTRERGLVHVGWVPQQLILSHVAVGCYLCHAGFSSMVEGLVNGCRLVLLPLKGDQFFNAKLAGIEGIMKVGVEVNTSDEEGYFGKEDVAAAVKAVAVDVDVEPGRSVRLNQKKWQSFLEDKVVQDKFISDMVDQLKIMMSDS